MCRARTRAGARSLEHMATPLIVIASIPVLRRALAEALGHERGVCAYADITEVPVEYRKAVMLITTSDGRREQCAALVAGGAHVVVLGSLPRPSDTEEYLGAGAAAFLPMPAGYRELLAAVAGAGSPPAARS